MTVDSATSGLRIVATIAQRLGEREPHVHLAITVRAPQGRIGGRVAAIASQSDGIGQVRGVGVPWVIVEAGIARGMAALADPVAGATGERATRLGVTGRAGRRPRHASCRRVTGGRVLVAAPAGPDVIRVDQRRMAVLRSERAVEARCARPQDVTPVNATGAQRCAGSDPVAQHPVGVRRQQVHVLRIEAQGPQQLGALRWRDDHRPTARVAATDRLHITIHAVTRLRPVRPVARLAVLAKQRVHVASIDRRRGRNHARLAASREHAGRSERRYNRKT